MGYKLELDLPNVGEGVEVYIDGLGTYENPGEYEITDEQANGFRVAHQVVTYHTDPDNGMIASTDVELGPTIEEYFADREGISVTETKPAPAKKAAASSQSGSQNNSPVEGEANKAAGDGSNQAEGGN